MSATRIYVEWMTAVPASEGGCAEYDRASWACKQFPGDAIDTARKFARTKAASNPWRQAWIRIEHAPSENANEWEWQTDHESEEIIEACT